MAGPNYSTLTFSIPVDFNQRREFIKLETCLEEAYPDASTVLATYFYVSLWQELAYYSVLIKLGCIEKEDFRLLYRKLHVARAIGLTEEKVIALYMQSGLLADKGDHFFCMWFFMCNEIMSRDLCGNYTQRGMVLVLRNRMERYAKLCRNQLQQVSLDRFEEVDGAKIGKEEMNRIWTIIRVLDSIYGRAEREPKEFTESLVHQACRFLRALGAEKVNAVLRRIMMRKKIPGVPRSTEIFLSDVKASMEVLEPDSGWWSELAKPSFAEDKRPDEVVSGDTDEMEE